MNVILMGYRASGKTSIGRKLASSLWYSFADVDQETCRRFSGRTIAEIWKELGEAEFRRVEVEVARELVQRPKHVIALGGGTVMEPAGRQAVIDAPDAIRIYLQCHPEELHRRITGDAQSPANRPGLTSLGGSLEEITTVLASREPTYREVADKVVDVTHLSIDAAVQYLLSKCV